MIVHMTGDRNYHHLRARRLADDRYVQMLHGQRRYAISKSEDDIIPVCDVEVWNQIRAGALHTLVTVGAAVILISGPLELRPEYSGTDLDPAYVTLVCCTCGWEGKRRAWTARRYMVGEASGHRCGTPIGNRGFRLVGPHNQRPGQLLVRDPEDHVVKWLDKSAVGV